jgi:hypothetical protein
MKFLLIKTAITNSLPFLRTIANIRKMNVGKDVAIDFPQHLDNDQKYFYLYKLLIFEFVNVLLILSFVFGKITIADITQLIPLLK